MTTPTIRDHCATLAGDVDYLLACVRAGSSDSAALEECRDHANAARDALAAAPEGEPSNEELVQLAIDTRLYRFQATAGDPIQYEMTEQQVHAFARAVLSRWGRPAAPPAPMEGEGPPAVTIGALLHPAFEPGDGSADGAQLVGMQWWHPVMGCDSLQMVVDNARAVLTRWGRPAANAITVDDWLAVALVAQDMRSRGLAEQVCADELLKLANSNRSQPACPSTPPAPPEGEVEA